MAWQSECSRKYLEKRRDEFFSDLTTDNKGCKFSPLAPRSSGEGQIKLRWIFGGKAKQASPRPWTLDLFLKGVAIPVGSDCSHLCGKGLYGCVNPDHIVVETHSTNMDRKDCHRMTKCPCGCNVTHSVQVCSHTPPCIQ